MRRFGLVFAILLALGFWACGDDDEPAPSGGGDDTGVADTGGGADMGDDTTVDDTGTGGDTTTGDATDDTSVADMGPDIPMPEGCLPDDGTCEGDQACIGGGCVDPVEDPEEYAGEAADRPASYWFRLQFPALFNPPERCCFDYTGEGIADDSLGGLIALIAAFAGSQGGASIDVQGTVDISIQDGTLTLVNDWTQLPAEGEGEARFSLFLATAETQDTGMAAWDPTIGEDPEPAGDGEYTLNGESFGDYGALVQFNLANIVEDIPCPNDVADTCLVASSDEFIIPIDIEALGTGPIVLTLVDARVAAPISIEADGVHTVDFTLTDEDDEEFMVGGGALGGVVPADQIFTILDDQLRACTCAGIDDTQPVLNWGVEGTGEDAEYVVECTDNVGDGGAACGDSDGPLCANITLACGAMGLVPTALDVDTDGDLVGDAISAGLRFAWTGASITGLTPTTE